jgi:hypothetical protein
VRGPSGVCCEGRGGVSSMSMIMALCAAILFAEGSKVLQWVPLHGLPPVFSLRHLGQYHTPRSSLTSGGRPRSSGQWMRLRCVMRRFRLSSGLLLHPGIGQEYLWVDGDGNWYASCSCRGGVFGVEVVVWSGPPGDGPSTSSGDGVVRGPCVGSRSGKCGNGSICGPVYTNGGKGWVVGTFSGAVIWISVSASGGGVIVGSGPGLLSMSPLDRRFSPLPVRVCPIGGGGVGGGGKCVW